MNARKNRHSLDKLIRRAVGRRDALSFDWTRWKQSNQRRLDEFQSQTPPAAPGSIVPVRLGMSRTLKIAAAALIFLAVCLGVPHLGRRDSHHTAFAQLAEQIEKAKTITWKITFYNHRVSKDGQRAWLESETRDLAYKAPGLYREVMHETIRGHRGHTDITDAANLKMVHLDPTNKSAVVQELAVTTFDPRGPFTGIMKHLNEPDLQWVEKRQTAGGEVNVFRRTFKRPDGKIWSYDFWIDAQTKRLVAVQAPGADIYDLEADPLRNNPVEKEWSTGTAACYVVHDINFDAELDDSLFSLEPPAGYTVEIERRARVTEAEMIEYLGVMADYNDRTFPDRPYSIDSDKLNAIHDKAEQARTPAEQKLLDTVDRYKMASLNMMPTAHFIEDHTVRDSFRYLGKGVKLGDEDRIVCWYRLKGSPTYRVVYGDLSVRDMAPADLPLSVEP
jgi:outer membrane lipoprotein-sorting protein